MTLSSESGKCKMLPPTPPLTSHSPHLTLLPCHGLASFSISFAINQSAKHVAHN